MAENQQVSAEIAKKPEQEQSNINNLIGALKTINEMKDKN